MSKNKSALLEKEGATISVVLMPPKALIEKLKSEGKEIPKARFRALIDTGAESTSVSEQEIASIGLISRDFGKLIGTSGEKISHVFDVTLSIEFAERPVEIYLEVSTIDLDQIGVYCLLGRDI